MSVLCVIGSLDSGGTERHLLMVLPELRRRGFDVEVLCIRAEGSLAACMRATGVAVHALEWNGRSMESIHPRPARVIATFLACDWFLRRHRFDLVHFFLPEAYLVGGLCAVAAGIGPCIMSRRSLNLYQRKYPFAATVERWLHARMRVILGNSRAVLAELAREGVPEEKLRLVYNGLDTARFDGPFDRLETRRELGLPDDALVVTSVANLIAYKGHEDLLRALVGVRERMPDNWRLVLVGRDDGIGKALRALAESLGISGQIVWAGVRDDIPAILAASDIGVLASHEEGFSNAILEGMAARLPMVVTDVGGNAEAVVDGETGRVVPARDPCALGEAILEMARSEARVEIGVRGRRKLEDEYSLERCVDAYESYYRGVGVTPRGCPQRS